MFKAVFSEMFLTGARAETRRDHIRNVLVAYAAIWLWAAFAIPLIILLYGESAGAVLPPVSPVLSVSFGLLQDRGIGLGIGQMLVVLAAALTFAPMFEEVLFRVLPMTLVKGRSPEVVLAVQLAVCGVAFGWAHGSIINVALQGFIGFVLARLYVANLSSMLNAWISCAAVHAAYNLHVMLLLGR